MAWTYTITIAGVGTVNVESISQVLKIDESLDSAQLVIPRTTRKATYPRFAEVSIVVSDGTNTESSYWITYSDKVSVSSVKSTLRYEHTLGLIEPTKRLEKYQCGSLTFTQPTSGSRYSMYDVVERIRQLTPFVPYADVSSTRIFTIDSTLSTYLDTIDAPQFYLDKKNLREALIEVFKYVHAIPRIRFTSIAGAWVLYADYINNWQTNITPNGETIVELGNIDYTSQVDSEDYATAFESNIENAIPSEDNSDANVLENSITDIVTFRSDDIKLGESNFKLLLNYQIANLISFKAVVTVKDTTSGTVYREYELDLNDYIYEKKVYDTLDYNSAQGNKPYACYWVYGTNEIAGLSDSYGFLSLQIAAQNILNDALDDQVGTSGYELWFATTGTSILEAAFLVSYIPYVETMRTIQYREDIVDVPLIGGLEATNQLNPRERISALYDATNNVYGQAQRLGVDTLAISKKHRTLHVYDDTHTDGIYSLGDYTNDGYIITAVEKVYFNAFVIARYELSKNFNRIAQFIAIDREFRPYEISLLKSDKTLKRNILMPFMHVSLSIGLSELHISNSLITPFMDTFKTGTYDERVCGAAFRIGASAGVISDVGVYLPAIAAAEKNTIKFKVDFRDTKSAGDRITKRFAGLTDYYKKELVNYTNDDGTARFAQIDLYHHYWDRIYTSGNEVADSLAHQVGLAKIGMRLPKIDISKNFMCGELSYSSPAFIDNELYVAHIYDLYTMFPVTGVENDYYYAIDTNIIYQWNSPNYDVVGYAVAQKNDLLYSLPIYDLKKDGAEILGLEMCLPITIEAGYENAYVIGDMLAKDNCLIKNRTASKTLYFYTSTVRFNKANTAVFDSATTTKTATTVNAYVGTNYITIPLGLSGSYDYIGIGDNDGKMYLGINLVDLEGDKMVQPTSVYFNFVSER